MIKTKLVLTPMRQEDSIGDIGVEISEQCLSCIHFDWEMPITCKAFPKGIFKSILDGKFDHVKVYPGQDNDIVFEKKK